MKNASKSNNRCVPILFVLPTLGTGGSEQVVFKLCLHLKSKYRPIIAAFRDGALREKIEASGIVVYVLNRKAGIDLSLVVSLVKIIKMNKIRVANSHHFVSLFYLYWATRYTGIAHIHTEHSKWEMEGLSSFWNWWFRFFLKKIEFVTAVSNETYLYLKNHYSVADGHLELAINGIDIEQFKNAKNEAVSRESLGLDANDFIIGCVGNLRDEKNQALLITALSILKKISACSYKLILVGDGACREKLKKLSDKLDVREDVLFLGVQHQTQRFYGVFDLYCLVSHYEGLPLTLLEAMASKVPVVGTDVLGIREVIRHEVNGILTPDNDAYALAEVITSKCHDPDTRNRYVRAGLRLVEEGYNLENFLFTYEKIFHQFSYRDKSTNY